MNPRDFAYWLHGYFELAGAGPLTAEQTALIAKHLDLVFKQVVPPMQAPAQTVTAPLQPIQPPWYQPFIPSTSQPEWHRPFEITCDSGVRLC